MVKLWSSSKIAREIFILGIILIVLFIRFLPCDISCLCFSSIFYLYLMASEMKGSTQRESMGLCNTQNVCFKSSGCWLVYAFFHWMPLENAVCVCQHICCASYRFLDIGTIPNIFKSDFNCDFIDSREISCLHFSDLTQLLWFSRTENVQQIKSTNVCLDAKWHFPSWSLPCIFGPFQKRRLSKGTYRSI